ncbi:hypothetical protein PLEOSDRAFT_1027446, partial [Pleurotus ostreatus PC15]
WYPWPDKEMCLVDIIKHLPRSLWSESQLEIYLWSLRMFGVNKVPSIQMVKDFEDDLQARCGIKTLRREGKLGNLFYLNDLAGIVSQEMANPRVRPQLHFYPEDSHPRLEECWQADRWLKEIDPTLTTPMIRKNSHDFYILEPTKMMSGDIIIPERWFTRVLNGQEQFYAVAYRATAAGSEDPSTAGYVMHAHERLVVSANEILLNFPQMISTYQSDGLPDPRNIIALGILHEPDGPLSPWTLTDPRAGNRWRALAKGHRVSTFMMWLYCDDTSGNVSKKWNKHNSFLFTAAGLPRSSVHQASNIHFLCTSNLSPPLEMLDGIVDQLDKYQAEGIWAWDAVFKEMVLVIPVVLALLGDNPMQSELACHIGLKGRHFCRVCMVYSHEPPKATSDAQQPGAPSTTGSTGSDAIADPLHSLAAASNPSKKKAGRDETFQELVDRATRFLGTSLLRTKEQSVRHLHGMFHDASAFGGKTRYGAAKTATGLKDMFLEHFTERIFNFAGDLRGTKAVKDQAVALMVSANIPDNPFSPVWRIKGLDPHQDTPVEVLHTVLLGFVKYLWRDAVSRCSDSQKHILKTRIESFDANGLSIAKLAGAGERLVTYAGSLTGSDFRIVSQIAPFILHGLVPQECYNSWLALSELVPLIWQPCIPDIDAHLASLQQAIDRLLTCIACWTPRWFNKPKFHIIQHLPSHVRRFGPAILFATENFESFNGVIRDHSVHTNRKAPSRDIGRGMAQFSRIRHLLSGGSFVPTIPPEDDGTQVERLNIIIDDPARWRTTGPLAKSLVAPYVTQKNLLSDALGLTEPDAITGSLSGRRLSRFNTFKTITAANGDRCEVPAFVIVRSGPASDNIAIGRVLEIVQVVGSPAAHDSRADYILLDVFEAKRAAAAYKLPHLQHTNIKQLINGLDILCTVNVQHNCAANGCTESGVRAIYQEREATARMKPTVVHQGPTDDLILNTAQMRDAVWIQYFRIPTAPLDRANAILHGAQAEIDSRTAKA